jgi:hypothetical protein
MPWKDKSRSTDNTNPSLSSNSGGTNHSESFGAVDTRANGVSHASVTNLNSSSSSSPSSPARQSKQNISSSTLHTSAQQWAYQRGAQSATTAAKQIEADMHEVRNVIANYAVEPVEILHLGKLTVHLFCIWKKTTVLYSFLFYNHIVDRWLQQLLTEFFEQRDHFKYQLRENWHRQELTNLKYNNNDQIRKIYAVYKELEQARESFDELNSYLEKTDELKQKFNFLIEQYFKILQCLEFVEKEINAGVGDNYIGDIKNQLLRLKKLNDKQSHTICIVGLEKAGKSTFINALLGYELLPTASE